MADPVNYSYNGIVRWAKNLDGITNDITAKTAATLATARTLTIKDSSNTNAGSAVSFNGGSNIVLNLPATIKASITGNCSGSSGSCTGNAATATKLATARTISLSGAVTGSGTFDGGGNLSLATTLASSLISSDIIAVYLDGWETNTIMQTNHSQTNEHRHEYIILVPLSGLGGLDSPFYKFSNGSNSSASSYYEYILIQGGTIERFRSATEYNFPVPFLVLPSLLVSPSRDNPCGYVWGNSKHYSNTGWRLEADVWRTVGGEGDEHVCGWLAIGRYDSSRSPSQIKSALASLNGSSTVSSNNWRTLRAAL